MRGIGGKHRYDNPVLLTPLQKVHLDMARVAIGNKKAIITTITSFRLGKAIENAN